MQNITYLLGAGASAQAMPTVANFPEKMRQMANYINTLPAYTKDNSNESIVKDNSLSRLIEYRKRFVDDLNNYADLSEEFTTPDTYAKYLFLNRKTNEINKFKLTLSIFIYLYYYTELTSNVKEGNIFKRIAKQPYSIDNRYIPLLTSLLKIGQLGIVDVPKEVSFISWNYDTQLESSLLKILNYSDFSDLYNLGYLHSYHDSYYSSPRIIHLNGIAGFYLNKDNRLVRFNNSHQYDKSKPKDILQIFQDLFAIFYNHNNNQNNSDNFGITFAWEKTKYSNNAIHYSREILKNTDFLVIIGYSFPFFNRDIDRELMWALKQSAKIYYQDPNAAENNIKKQFGLQNEAETWTDTKQFFIPHEF